MVEQIFFVATLLAALGCALMAGTFFIFSNTVMRSLAQMEVPEGIRAMQIINRVIVNPLFIIAFLGTAVVSLLLALGLLWQGQQPGTPYLLSGILLYLLGVMVVTVVFNVPMNNALDGVTPESDEGTTLWSIYLSRWTRWNHVRTVASILGTAAFMLAL